MNAFKDENFIQYNKKKVKNETKNLTLYFIVHITLYVALFFFLLFFAWYTYFVITHEFFAVKGVSMMPTLNSQIEYIDGKFPTNFRELSYDAVYVDKSTPTRIYDMVVVRYSPSESVIKRLMATEGDYITISKGRTEDGKDCFYYYRIPKGTDLSQINDEEFKIDESTGENGYEIFGYEDWYQSKVSLYTPVEYIITSNGVEGYEYFFYNTFLSEYNTNDSDFNYFTSPNGLVYVQVPQGKCFFMGDNRGHSTDGRENGFCDNKNIVGRVEFIVKNYSFVNRVVEVIKFYFSEMEKFFAR